MEKAKKKILVIRFSSIGDIVLCSPIIRCLHQQLGAEVHFLTKAKFASINEANPHIHHIWTIESKVSEVVEQLQEEDFDLVVDLHKNLRSWQVKSKLRKPIFHFDKINFEKWMRVYTRINLLPKLHIVDRYFRGMKELGIKNDGRGLDYFYPKEATLVLAKNQLLKERYVAVVLGANFHTKRVPRHYVDHLVSEYKGQIVLLGGNDVFELGKEVVEGKDHVVNLCGKNSIHESAAIIDNSSVVISGDTGMMHIAAALNKKLITVWGSTHHDLGMYPYYPEAVNKNISIARDDMWCRPCSKIGRDICPLGHSKCIRSLDKNRLMSALDRQM